MRRLGLVTKPGKEGLYETEVNGRSVNLGHSAFNVAWLKEVTGPPSTIVELGAFDGGDVLRFHRAFPDCRIVAIEADPDRVETVRQNLVGTPIETIHTAVCEADGQIDWYVAEIDGKTDAQGSIYQHTEFFKNRFPFVNQINQPIKVDSRRLDSLCAEMGIQDIDLLHIDIEGAEFVALKGMGALRPKMIFSEIRKNMFESGIKIVDTEALLESLDYELAIDLRVDRLYIHRSCI